eukprot:TRINITY_DN8221_c0_g1_i1.p1 TRINITY_DN8221_c0_g1~~TRINITY_DN8221_c0_g1_i1.p1  ORF type:complete len:183 (-),score=48.96 TRINITY_DN8221_c0_g1_i1:85-633(-)
MDKIDYTDNEAKETKRSATLKKVRTGLGILTDKNLLVLKILNRECLAVQYKDDYYETVEKIANFTKFAFYNDQIVGAISTQPREEGGDKSLYVKTLAVLEPYRHLGLATMMVEYYIEFAKKDPEMTKVWLHVLSNNDAAVSFYEKLGFTVESTIDGYYKDMTPNAAKVLVFPLSRDDATADE